MRNQKERSLFLISKVTLWEMKTRKARESKHESTSTKLVAGEVKRSLERESKRETEREPPMRNAIIRLVR